MLKGHRFKARFSRVFSSQFGMVFSDWLSLAFLFLTVLVLSLVAGWFPDGLSAIFFEHRLKQGLIMVGVSVIFLLLILLFARWLAGSYRYEVYSTTPSRKKMLVLFLSNLRGDVETLNGELNRLLERLSRAGSSGEKLELINSSLSFRSWRMPLEAVGFHLPVLERVVVITSKESSPQFPLFKRLVGELYPELKPSDVKEVRVDDFEDFNSVQEAIERVYDVLKSANYRNRDVILDITGGKKIVSIVGALLSLNPGREFQYISTTDYTVKSYDVEVTRDD